MSLNRNAPLAAMIAIATFFGCGAWADSEIVIINGDRIFTVDEFTEYFSDGDGVDAKFFQQVGTGKPASFNLKSGANEDLTQGLLERINLLNELRGPVTSVRPLTVFRQQIVVTDRTVRRSLPALLTELEIGAEVEVSGFTARTNVRRATSLSLDPDESNDWQLTGFVGDPSDDGFRIGFQPVLFNGVTVEDCDGPLQRGDFVEVRATPDPEFLKSLVLQTATSIRCVARVVPALPGETIPASIDGAVTEIIDDVSFRVAQQIIRITPSTQFLNGEANAIALGVRVEAQGPLDANTSELTARRVEFQEVRVSASGPVVPEDVTLGESITVLGLTFAATAATQDPVGVLDLGLSRPTQVEALGYRDVSGRLVLTRLRASGRPDAANVSIRGLLTEIARPQIRVLGVAVDTTAAIFEQDDTVIDADVFFAQVTIGSQVDVTDGSYDEATGTVTAGTVRVAAAADTEIGGTPDGKGAGIGTITLSQDCLFVGGFEPETP